MFTSKLLQYLTNSTLKRLIQEQQLEEFYNRIGSKYVSEVVKKDYEVQGRMNRDTPLTNSFASRIRERRPLLLSPTISSRPLLPNASKVLDDQYLEIVQVDSIQAKYSFDRSSKLLEVTCCSKPLTLTSRKTTVFVTNNFDCFDVGTAIGGLILQRCQLEDAFFLSSLLEAPLGTLRSRGFPVDRILRPVASPPSPKEIETKIEIPPETRSKSSDTATKREETTSKDSVQHPRKGDAEGFETILEQMFPSCPPDVVRALLGQNPTKEKAREVANLLASGNFSPSDAMEKTGEENVLKDGSSAKMHDSVDMTNVPPVQQHIARGSNGVMDKNQNEPETAEHKAKSKEDNLPRKKSSSKSSSSLMGKILGGFRHGGGDGGGSGRPSSTNRQTKQVIHHHAHHTLDTLNSNAPSSPENDATSQKSLDAMLQQAIESSRSVNTSGVSSPETMLQSLPQGLEIGNDGCVSILVYFHGRM